MQDGLTPDMPYDFVPGPETGRAYRDALGQFGTGVTIITAEGSDGPMGMTANSFASVSLDPALVLWSPAKSSTRFPIFADAKHYAIHVMREDQQALAGQFARNGQSFDQCDWSRSAEDVPILNDCLARFECVGEAQHDAGDHVILVGRVLRARLCSGKPLLFAGGKYGRFNEAG
jgi:flavin reductase (DIM6/NTAB) family NADH-FMN oxidoreductase RutF